MNAKLIRMNNLLSAWKFTYMPCVQNFVNKALA